MNDTDRSAVIFEQIGQSLVDSLPPGWESVVVQAHLIDATGQFNVAVRKVSGESSSVHAPMEVYPLFDELRKVTYEPRRGAWFIATFTLRHDGDFGIEFDYESEPDLLGVSDEDYLDDLQKFPREPSLIPTWMPRPTR